MTIRSPIFLIRHGQTEWNAAGRFQGALDSPLTRLGERQADAIGRALAREAAGLATPLAAHVSPRGRARRTAELASVHLALDEAIEPRLAEINMGAWDGLTTFEIDADYPGALDGLERTEWMFRGPGGETFDDLSARVAAWLEGLEDRPVAAFSHGLAGRVIRGLYLGQTRRDMLAQASPQDGFFVLEGGAARYVATG